MKIKDINKVKNKKVEERYTGENNYNEADKTKKILENVIASQPFLQTPRVNASTHIPAFI